MSSDGGPPVLAVRAISKAYPAWAGGSRSLRDVITGKAPLRRKASDDKFALRDVTIEVAAGESVGLIGGNGAGKSTLLRIASGLVQPTTGTVQTPPGTTAVLTLGESFATDLTGSENAVTAAVVAGFSPRRARELLPAILAYAELEDAASAPVRTYSEGMKLRLAFAVVAQTRPPAMLLDEVMAVGDLRFQRKAQARIRQARESGAAILVATHDLSTLEQECDRAVWLQHGTVRLDGPAVEVAAAYRRAMMDETVRRTPETGDGEPDRLGSQEATLESVVLHGRTASGTRTAIHAGDGLRIECVISAPAALPVAPVLALGIFRDDGVCCCSLATDRDQLGLAPAAGRQSVVLELDRIDLLPATYRIEVGVYREDWEYAYDFLGHAAELEVIGSDAPHGVVLPPHRWTVG